MPTRSFRLFLCVNMCVGEELEGNAKVCDVCVCAMCAMCMCVCSFTGASDKLANGELMPTGYSSAVPVWLPITTTYNPTHAESVCVCVVAECVCVVVECPSTVCVIAHYRLHRVQCQGKRGKRREGFVGLEIPTTR